MRGRKGASRGRKLRPAQALPTPHQQTPFERERTTKRRGEISELAFALAAARHGFGIAKPYGDSEVTLSPKRRRKPHVNDPYREAWHLLHQSDGIEFA